MQISSDRKTLPSQDPGDVDLPIDQLVSGLALRYRLIDQKQAALIADRQFGQIACACQKRNAGQTDVAMERYSEQQCEQTQLHHLRNC